MREEGDTKEKRYSVFYSYGRFFQGGFFSWLIPATTIVLVITKQILDIIQPRTRQNGGANEARIRRRPSVTRSVAKNNETSREIAVVEVAETDRAPCDGSDHRSHGAKRQNHRDPVARKTNGIHPSEGEREKGRARRRTSRTTRKTEDSFERTTLTNEAS